MDVIIPFVENECASGNFKVRIEDGPSFVACCTIRFVFLTISAPKLDFQSTIFLPEYGPAINFGSEQSGKVLMYTPLDIETHKGFTIEGDEQIKIDQFFQLSMNAILSLNEFMKLFTEQIKYNEHIIAIFPPNDLDRPIFLMLADGKLVFDDNATSIYELEITPRTEIKFPGVGEFQGIGVSDQSNQIICIQTRTAKSLMSWYLVLCINKHLIIEKQKKLIEGIETIQMFSPVEEEEKTNTTEEATSEEIPALTPASKENTEETSAEEASSPFSNNIELEKESQEQTSFEKIVVPDINPYILEQEERRKELSSKNESTKTMLQKQLLKYKNKVHVSCDPIPQLEYPKPPPVQKAQNEPAVELKPFILPKEQALSMVDDRFQAHFINIKHYFKHPKPSPYLPALKLEYNPDDRTAFFESYIIASPEATYNMLLGIVLCQFADKSIAKVYDIKGNFRDLTEEAVAVVDLLKGKIPQFILSSPEVRKHYRISSIACDVELLKKLPLKDPVKPSRCEPVFTFPHRPILDLRFSMYEALLNAKIRKLNPLRVFQDFSRAWIAIFQNNLSRTLDSFFTSIANELRGNDTWAIFKTDGEFRQKWALFLLHSMREEKVMENLLEVFNYPNIISRHYNLCAEVRNHDIVAEVVLLTQAFAECHIKISNDGLVEEPLPGKQIESIFQ